MLSRQVVCLIAFIFSLSFLVACSSDTDFQDSQGNSIHFSDFKGKWVILNYWAKWCHACIAEIPVLNEFSRTYADNVVVIGVSYDDLSAQQLNQLANELGITYPLLLNKPNRYLKLGVISVVPTTVILNPQGKLESTLLGPQTKDSLKKSLHWL